MFLCRECLKKEDEKMGKDRIWLFTLHMLISYGACEDCGKVKECVDC